MRLRNYGKFGGYLYRVILDSVVDSVNYIERTKGCFYDDMNDIHKCLRSLRRMNWIKWSRNDTYCFEKCCCGQQASIEIMSFDQRSGA